MAFNKKDLSLALIAFFPGLSAVTASAAIIAYQAVFPRYERPDYSLVAGEYHYPRVAPRLPRREIKYKPHEYTLRGYIYGEGNDRGLVLLRHGIRAGADDYLPVIDFLVCEGYTVFTYDATGTFESEGESTVGMCQAIIDLEATVKYIRTLDGLKDLPLYLLGHSWGAYAVTSSLCVIDGVSAVGAISGMNNGTTMIADKAREYVKLKGLVDFPDAVFRMYQKMLFGKYVEYSAVKGINRAGIPAFISHGVDDKTIRLDNGSIISFEKDLTAASVSYYLGKGLQGSHTGILHSPDAVAYQLEVDSELNLIKMKNGTVTDADRAELYSKIDHRRYSAPNAEMLHRLLLTFDSAK